MTTSDLHSNERYRLARLARDQRFDGQFFIAVKTTGIFCRPICPANPPKEENVEYFTVAHSAMAAGYRPCLRCRPDSAPDSFAWKGVDTTVERAVQLLKSHPDLTLMDLSIKLGISDRYLRALFQRRLGISPKQYQLFEKTLFAKQLLHQTNLTVEQVAQASGFSSSRRLQTQLKRVMGLTPLQIRRSDQRRNSALKLQVPYRKPYNWHHLRDFLAVRAVEGMEWVTDISYGRHFQFAGARGRFEAEFDQRKGCFDINIEIDDLALLKPVLTEIKRVLDVDTDCNQIEPLLVNAGLSTVSSGLRLPGLWSHFEAGCRAILGQQVSVKAAIKLLSQLVLNLGESYADGVLFPSPKAVSEDPLSFLKMPDSRRQTLRRFATWYGEFGSSSDIDKWLTVKGIGPWTVAYAKLRGRSDPDVFLSTDLVVRKQLETLAIDELACAPWRSYLTLQLWERANAEN